MKKVRELRGLIYSQYDTEAALANKLGWTSQRLNKITNGIREPDLEELNVLSGALNCPVSELLQIFLRHKSPDGQRPA